MPRPELSTLRYPNLWQGCVGAWCPSLGASGYRLIDRSGYNNHGTLTNMDPGTDWVPSGGKLALDFDGTDDYVSASFPAIELSTQDGSISAWVITPSTTSGVLVSIGNASNFNPFLTIEGSSPGVGTRNDLGGDLFSVTGGTFTSEWRLLTVVSTPTRTTLYQNGVVVNSVTQTSTNTRTYNRFSFAVRNRIGSLSGFGACLVDDARVYNRALTPSEIRLLYTGGRGVGLLPEVKPKRTRTVFYSSGLISYLRRRSYNSILGSGVLS